MYRFFIKVILSVFCDFNELCESCLIVDCHIGEYFSVEVDVCLLKTVYEF